MQTLFLWHGVATLMHLARIVALVFTCLAGGFLSGVLLRILRSSSARDSFERRAVHHRDTRYGVNA